MSDFQDNERAIKKFQDLFLVSIDRQVMDIIQSQIEPRLLKLREELEKLYIEFKRDVLAAIGVGSTPSIVTQGRASLWEQLSLDYEDRKIREAAGEGFFLYQGNLKDYFASWNPKNKLGAPEFNQVGSSIGKSPFTVDKQGRLRRIKGQAGAGQFVKDLRKQIFSIQPKIFPRARGFTSATINTLFPRSIANRLWNRNRPFRPLVGPIINVYQTVKLNEAINRAFPK